VLAGSLRLGRPSQTPVRPAHLLRTDCPLTNPPVCRTGQSEGPPDFITGCTVTGDLAALAAGQRTELGLQARVTVTDAAHVSARVTVTDAARVSARVAKAAVPGHTPPGGFLRDPGRPVIIVDNFPPYASPDDIAVSIGCRPAEGFIQIAPRRGR
jgi:hypothetical protein